MNENFNGSPSDEQNIGVAFYLFEGARQVALLHKSVFQRPWWKCFFPIDFTHSSMVADALVIATGRVVDDVGLPKECLSLAELVHKCAVYQSQILAQLKVKADGGAYNWEKYSQDLQAYDSLMSTLRSALKS